MRIEPDLPNQQGKRTKRFTLRPNEQVEPYIPNNDSNRYWLKKGEKEGKEKTVSSESEKSSKKEEREHKGKGIYFGFLIIVLVLIAVVISAVNGSTYDGKRFRVNGVFVYEDEVYGLAYSSKDGNSYVVTTNGSKDFYRIPDNAVWNRYDGRFYYVDGKTLYSVDAFGEDKEKLWKADSGEDIELITCGDGYVAFYQDTVDKSRNHDLKEYVYLTDEKESVLFLEPDSESYRITFAAYYGGYAYYLDNNSFELIKTDRNGGRQVLAENVYIGTGDAVVCGEYLYIYNGLTSDYGLYRFGLRDGAAVKIDLASYGIEISGRNTGGIVNNRAISENVDLYEYSGSIVLGVTDTEGNLNLYLYNDRDGVTPVKSQLKGGTYLRGEVFFHNGYYYAATTENKILYGKI